MIEELLSSERLNLAKYNTSKYVNCNVKHNELFFLNSARNYVKLFYNNSSKRRMQFVRKKPYRSKQLLPMQLLFSIGSKTT